MDIEKRYEKILATERIRATWLKRYGGSYDKAFQISWIVLHG